MKAYLLDTHYWVWLQMGEPQRLKRPASEELISMQREGALYLSAISILEVARLTAEGRLNLGMSIDQFVEEATSDDGFQILPLTTKILIESTRLPGIIHRDPANQMLAATAREHGLVLITQDKLLLQYASQGHLKARKL